MAKKAISRKLIPFALGGFISLAACSNGDTATGQDPIVGNPNTPKTGLPGSPNNVFVR